METSTFVTFDLGPLISVDAFAAPKPISSAHKESGAIQWFASQIGPNTFGVLDAFENVCGRSAHIAGEISKALGAKAAELLSKNPVIEKVEIIAVKT